MNVRRDDEQGVVKVSDPFPGQSTADVLTFRITGQEAGLRVVMDGGHSYEEPERTTKDRGPLVGLQLAFEERQRFVHGRPSTVAQEVPDTVVTQLLKLGASEVDA